MKTYSFTLKNESNGSITQVNNATIGFILKTLEKFKSKEGLNSEVPKEIMKSARKIRSKKELTNRH